jgi:hypothetical protein
MRKNKLCIDLFLMHKIFVEFFFCYVFSILKQSCLIVSKFIKEYVEFSFLLSVKLNNKLVLFFIIFFSSKFAEDNYLLAFLCRLLYRTNFHPDVSQCQGVYFTINQNYKGDLSDRFAVCEFHISVTNRKRSHEVNAFQSQTVNEVTK